MQEQLIPYGYCYCGCGRKTVPSNRTDAARGLVRGQPRFYINGHNRRGKSGTRIPLAERIAKHTRSLPNGCVEWTGAKNPKGYGDIGPGLAHRIVWEFVNGPIPEGLQIDHLCRNRACVNPDHLEPVTPRENIVRGWMARRGTKILRGQAYATDSGKEIGLP